MKRSILVVPLSCMICAADGQSAETAYVEKVNAIERRLDRNHIVKWKPLRRRPQLRVVRDMEESDQTPSRRDVVRLQERMDELLVKIHEQGQESLTESERAELNEASRYLRERR